MFIQTKNYLLTPYIQKEIIYTKKHIYIPIAQKCITLKYFPLNQNDISSIFSIMLYFLRLHNTVIHVYLL